MELRGELLDSVDALAPHLSEWDALAAEARRPYSAPAWVMAWWRHAAPPRAELRVLVAFEGDRLAGIAPFFAERDRTGLVRYRMVGARSAARIEPLARPGSEDDAAAAFCRVLAEARPRPGTIELNQQSPDGAWPERLARAWPGGARASRDREIAAPRLALDGGDFDAWLQGKSSNFRQQIRRTRRKLDEQGAEFRMSATPDELERDLASFARLHHARWEEKGGSAALTPERERMIADACHELREHDRARLWSIDVDGRTISSQLFVAAGGEVAYWLGGFDEAFARHRPALLALVVAIEDSFRRGERSVDLGPGAQDYKYRLADSEEMLADVTLVPGGPRAALTRAQLGPGRLRRAVARRLTPERRERLRGLLRRPTRSGARRDSA